MEKLSVTCSCGAFFEIENSMYTIRKELIELYNRFHELHFMCLGQGQYTGQISVQDTSISDTEKNFFNGYVNPR